MTIQSNEFIILGVCLWFLSFTVKMFYFKTTNKRIKIKNEVFLNLFAIYLIGLIAVTLFPISFGIPNFAPTYNYEPSFFEKYAFNLIPFINLFSNSTFEGGILTYFSLRAVLGNLILLTPLTMYLSIKYPKLNNFKSILFVGFATSFLIETLQFIENFISLSYPILRTINVDDLILNTFGALLGYFIIKLLLNSSLKRFISLEKNIFS